LAALDTSGVALAAIQALNTVVDEKEARIAALEESNTDLAARLAALEAGAETSPRDVSTGGGYGQLLVGLLLGAGIGVGALALGAQWRVFALGRSASRRSR
jgi:hypothetical protein